MAKVFLGLSEVEGGSKRIEDRSPQLPPPLKSEAMRLRKVFSRLLQLEPAAPGGYLRSVCELYESTLPVWEVYEYLRAKFILVGVSTTM